MGGYVRYAKWAFGLVSEGAAVITEAGVNRGGTSAVAPGTLLLLQVVEVLADVAAPGAGVRPVAANTGTSVATTLFSAKVVKVDAIEACGRPYEFDRL